MYCEKCGMYISDSDKGCINCSNKNDNKNNKNDIIKWVIIIVGILILINVVRLVISYFYIRNSYEYVKNSIEENWGNDLTRGYYANQDIEAGSMIYANMISSRDYMRSELPDEDYYLRAEDIVGKCVDYDVIVRKNSLFYEDMLVDCDELPENDYEEEE